MPSHESGDPSGKSLAALNEVIAGLQALVDTRPTRPGVTLEWVVSAYFLGDLNSLACLSLRSDR